MDRKQKEELIRTYLLRDPAVADNTLATLLGGVSKNKVADVRAEMEGACLIDKVTKRRGADGKTYPAKYPRIVVNSEREMEAALKAIKDLPANGKTLDATTAARRARRTAAKKAWQGEVIEPSPEDAIKLYNCPFQQLEQLAGIAPATVHLVCTDIPYGKNFLPQIGELAAMAERILVQGGLFAMHSGQYYLDQVMGMLGRHLTWRWMIASEWSGDANMVHPLDLGSQWKPILVYSKGPWRKRGRWYDVSRVDAKEKDYHDWQQPLEEVERLVRYFSDPGDLVVDPCGGGFTTALACRNLGRRCVSCDVDERAVVRGQERLRVSAAEPAAKKPSPR
jgi:site-specific DNA-methyltransferase (adenine-specific)